MNNKVTCDFCNDTFRESDCEHYLDEGDMEVFRCFGCVDTVGSWAPMDKFELQEEESTRSFEADWDREC